MIVLGTFLSLAGLAGVIWCLIEAFTEDTLQGVLCMCVPLYSFYYAIARIDSEKKWVIVGLMLAGIVGRVLSIAAT